MSISTNTMQLIMPVSIQRQYSIQRQFNINNNQNSVSSQHPVTGKTLLSSLLLIHKSLLYQVLLPFSPVISSCPKGEKKHGKKSSRFQAWALISGRYYCNVESKRFTFHRTKLGSGCVLSSQLFSQSSGFIALLICMAELS